MSRPFPTLAAGLVATAGTFGALLAATLLLTATSDDQLPVTPVLIASVCGAVLVCLFLLGLSIRALRTLYARQDRAVANLHADVRHLLDHAGTQRRALDRIEAEQGRFSSALADIAGSSPAAPDGAASDVASSVKKVLKDLTTTLDRRGDVGDVLQRVVAGERRVLVAVETLRADTETALARWSGTLAEALREKPGTSGNDEELAQTLRDEIRRQGIDVVRQVESVLQLQRTVDPEQGMLPLTGGWAMAADSLRYVADRIRRTSPRRVLEIGSGSSTVWTALYAHEAGAAVASLEHDPTYLEATRSLLVDAGLADTVDLRLAPLERVEVEGDSYEWYAASALAGLSGGVDIVVVDGPPGAVGHWARFPAFPLLRGLLSHDALIILDDTHRAAEREIVERWLRMDSGLSVEPAGLSRSTVLRYRRSEQG